MINADEKEVWTEEQIFGYGINGTCCRHMSFKLCCDSVCKGEKEFPWIVKEIRFLRGCPGNLSMLADLFNGQYASWIIKKCLDHKCGNRETSCMNEFAKCLKKAVEEMNYER